MSPAEAVDGGRAALDSTLVVGGASPSELAGGFGARAAQYWKAVPLAWRLAAIGLLGAAAAGVVGWLISKNPSASPAHLAGLVRVLVIASLIGAGLYAMTSNLQARMG